MDQGRLLHEAQRRLQRLYEKTEAHMKSLSSHCLVSGVSVEGVNPAVVAEGGAEGDRGEEGEMPGRASPPGGVVAL